LKKTAFTLLELMIVVVIMGVVYTLAITNFSRLSDDSSRVNLKTLKAYLMSQKFERSAKLLCLDECSDCNVYLDSKVTTKIEDFFDASVVLYRYEFNYGYTQKEMDVVFDKNDVEQDVCFSYEINKEGVGDQVLVEYKKHFYDYSPYLQDVAVYSSLSDAQEAHRQLEEEVLR